MAEDSHVDIACSGVELTLQEYTVKREYLHSGHQQGMTTRQRLGVSSSPSQQSRSRNPSRRNRLEAPRRDIMPNSTKPRVLIYALAEIEGNAKYVCIRTARIKGPQSCSSGSRNSRISQHCEQRYCTIRPYQIKTKENQHLQSGQGQIVEGPRFGIISNSGLPAQLKLCARNDTSKSVQECNMELSKDKKVVGNSRGRLKLVPWI